MGQIWQKVCLVIKGHVMNAQHKIGLIDMHSTGDVSRIIFDGVKSLPGKTVREQMEYLQNNADGLRKTLLFEPYGVPEMSIDLVVPACNKEAIAGYIIMEVMGYPIYSGSNTICTATAVIEKGLVEKKEGITQFKLEAPAGLVDIEANIQNGIVESITCEGLPSYIHTYKQKINVPSIGEVTYSIAYSGGFYVLVDAKELGFELVPFEEEELAKHALLIVEEIRKENDFFHYELGDVGPVPFLHFMGEVEQKEENLFSSKSVTFVFPNVICRGPTGTGTSARLALLHYENKIKPGQSLETISLKNTSFIGTIDNIEEIEQYKVIKNKIKGKSYMIAQSNIIINQEDSMASCEELSHIMDN